MSRASTSLEPCGRRRGWPGSSSGLDACRNDEARMTPRTATLIGLTAILMWSLLSVLTVATGKIPAFQLAAMTFAIGAAVGVRELPVPARRVRRVAAAAGRLGRRRRRPVRLSRAVFPGAALRAAGRSGPAELSLAAVDRAVLVAAAGRAAGAASHHRRAARACRHRAAVRRQRRRALRPARSRDWPRRSSRPLSGRPIR